MHGELDFMNNIVDRWRRHHCCCGPALIYRRFAFNSLAICSDLHVRALYSSVTIKWFVRQFACSRMATLPPPLLKPTSESSAYRLNRLVFCRPGSRACFNVGTRKISAIKVSYLLSTFLRTAVEIPKVVRGTQVTWTQNCRVVSLLWHVWQEFSFTSSTWHGDVVQYPTTDLIPPHLPADTGMASLTLVWRLVVAVHNSCSGSLSVSPQRFSLSVLLSGNLLWKAFGFHQRTVGSRGGSSQHARPAFHSIRFRVDFLVMSPPSSPVFFFRSQKRETESMTLRRKKLYQPMGTKCRDGLGSVPVFRPWKEKQSIPQFDLVWKENYV